jgi:hypothetical protein
LGNPKANNHQEFIFGSADDVIFESDESIRGGNLNGICESRKVAGEVTF